MSALPAKRQEKCDAPDVSRRLKLTCLGTIVTDRITFETSGRRIEHPGGNALIFGAASARLGIPTAVVGNVGDDLHGRRAVEFLSTCGVDTHQLRLLASIPTRVVDIVIQPDATWSRLSYVSGEFPYLTGEFSDCGSAHLHVAGLNSLARKSSRLLETIISAFRIRGAAVSFGLNSSACNPAWLRSTISASDQVFCSREEFSGLLGKSVDSRPETVLREVVESKYRNICVTLGSNGVVMRINQSVAHVMPPKLLANSTLGAGDIFAAAFLAARDSGHLPQRAGEIACSLAAQATKEELWSRFVLRHLNGTSLSRDMLADIEPKH